MYNLSRFLNPNPTLENSRNRLKTSENSRKLPKTFEMSDMHEISETCEKVVFSSEGHPAPILREECSAATLWPQPRHGHAAIAALTRPRHGRTRCCGCSFCIDEFKGVLRPTIGMYVQGDAEIQ